MKLSLGVIRRSSPSGGQNMARSHVREQLSGREDGPDAEKRPARRQVRGFNFELGGSFCLGCWLRFRFCGLPRLVLRSKVLLDLESDGVRINTVCLGRRAENFAFV